MRKPPRFSVSTVPASGTVLTGRFDESVDWQEVKLLVARRLELLGQRDVARSREVANSGIRRELAAVT